MSVISCLHRDPDKRRSGRLSEPHLSVKILVHAWRGPKPGAIVAYLGTLDALLAAGCVTAQNLAIRKRGVKSFDESGHQYRLYRSPSKAFPERYRVERRVYGPSLGLATELPRVSELFPEGLPKLHPEPAETEGDLGSAEPQADNLADWMQQERKGLTRCMWTCLAMLESSAARAGGVESIHEHLRDLVPDLPSPAPAARFRWSAGEVDRVRQFLKETEARFGALLRSLTAEDRQRVRLRMVVDNTREPRS